MQRVVRALSLPEVELLISWAAAEGWNPGLQDPAKFYVTGPEGFIGAFVGGEMVSGVSAVAYGGHYGFLGLFITRPDRRGEGHGKSVWEAAMNRLKGRTIGLDAVPARLSDYAALGFEAAYGTERLSGHLQGTEPTEAVRPVTPAMIEDLIRLDRSIFPAERREFLEHWLSPSHLALAVTDRERVTGYGVARQCREGWKLGPLCAPTPEKAFLLLSALSRAAGDPQLHLDIPDSARALRDQLLAMGFTTGFQTTRMYHGTPPGLRNPDHLFAITTLELG
ncbi:GNAT superfamily N-acetyltransferase [Rhodoligotrophos appendicifer]|uniref:GNAT family N-acetyltransferase n=1 Tax=Rhodoligotrophos appendicifer TaxID=987056 RepID=UPI00118683DE|nr:GNAT family N-acetyltransferase [Rhodoligotrophos appendicifer]